MSNRAVVPSPWWQVGLALLPGLLLLLGQRFYAQASLNKVYAGVHAWNPTNGKAWRESTA